MTPESEPAEPKRPWRAVVQLFLVPLLVVAVCAGLFFLFSLLTFENKTPAEYLSEVRGGGASQRWQSAFELSRAVARVPPGPQRQKLGAQTLEVFRHLDDSRAEDRDVKRYLALVLGRLSYGPARPSLEEAARSGDPQVRLYSIWALGMIGDAQAVPTVLELSTSEDSGVRKMAAYILGKLGDARALPRLRAMTADHAADVRWNAAVALAEMRDDSGKEVLHAMLDRRSLAQQAQGISALQMEDAMIGALKAEVLIGDTSALAAIRELSKSDGDMKVRDEAHRALAALEGKS
jgi:hypothetical protein